MDNIHLNILDSKRKKLLPLFKVFKGRFYLAGGTALALQLGHRDSIDFDFFTNKEFDPEALLREIKEIFAVYKIEVVQSGNKTLTLIIDRNVRVSFFWLREKLLRPAINLECLDIAGIDDIACMKINALLRAEFKDYVDLYYILKQKKLEQIIENCKRKYKGFDEMIYLKAMTSFEDINIPELLFVRGKKVTLEQIKKDFENRVKEYLRRL